MMIFFFSSRRRHTRCSRDWSSDVCSSDLSLGEATGEAVGESSYSISLFSPAADIRNTRVKNHCSFMSRSSGRSEERREGKSVDLGGRRIIKKKKKKSNRATAA